MIIEVIACEIGEYSAGEGQSSDTLLSDSVAGAFHESILTSCLHHLSEQGIELDRVWSGVVGMVWFAIDIVADSGEKSAFMSHLTEHII